jgi:hypothetical protein
VRAWASEATSSIATKKVREYIADWMPMSRTRSARSPKRLASASGRPKSLTSNAPATPKRSVIVAFIFASRS